MSAKTILLADDDSAIRTVLTQALSRAGYSVRSTATAAALWRWVSEGLLEREPMAYLQGGAQAGGLDEAAIEQMIADRAAAKKAKNFAESDRIRDELKAAGIALDDSPQGTSWRRA